MSKISEILRVVTLASEASMTVRALGLLDACEEAVPMGEIAKAVGHTTAAHTGMVDRLERRGYLRRYDRTASTDRRKTLIKRTAKGDALIARVNEILNTPPA